MRLPLPLVALALVATAATGCGVGDDRTDARNVAERLYAAYDDKDGEVACEQLTQDAQDAVESQTKDPCEKGVLDLELSGRHAARTQVFVTNAEVQFAEGDVAYLDRTTQGWRVSAAGCKPRGDLPAECEVES